MMATKATVPTGGKNKVASKQDTVLNLSPKALAKL